jgi:hypothetical protein
VSECHREHNGTTSGYCTKKMICLSYDDNLNDTDLWTFKKHACMHICKYIYFCCISPSTLVEPPPENDPPSVDNPSEEKNIATGGRSGPSSSRKNVCNIMS